MNAARDIRCALCGRMIRMGEACNRDHIIPQAVYKWARAAQPEITAQELAELESVIRHPDNVCIVHIHCNAGKEESFRGINTLYVSRRKRTALWNVYHRVKPQLRAFWRLKAMILEQQEGKCLCCGRVLKGAGVVRRIDPHQPRTAKNACLLCGACNRDPVRGVNFQKVGSRK